jgi:hypothetical protein
MKGRNGGDVVERKERESGDRRWEEACQRQCVGYGLNGCMYAHFAFSFYLRLFRGWGGDPSQANPWPSVGADRFKVGHCRNLAPATSPTSAVTEHRQEPRREGSGSRSKEAPIDSTKCGFICKAAMDARVQAANFVQIFLVGGTRSPEPV